MKQTVKTSNKYLFMKFNELNHHKQVILNKYNISIPKLKIMLNTVNKYGLKIRMIENNNQIILEKVNSNFNFNVFHK